MGVFDKILGRSKPARRRARGRGGFAAPDGPSERRTVLISGREEERAIPADPGGRDPWEETSAAPAEPSPQRAPEPRPAPPPPPAPPARSLPPARESEETIVGSARPSASGVVGVLVGLDGTLKDHVFRVFEGETSLGRTDATENLDDRHISRGHHAVIRHVAGYFSVEPLSEKGTFLNDRRIEATEPLSDRDKIRFGSEGATTFLFRSVE